MGLEGALKDLTDLVFIKIGRLLKRSAKRKRLNLRLIHDEYNIFLLIEIHYNIHYINAMNISVDDINVFYLIIVGNLYQLNEL